MWSPQITEFVRGSQGSVCFALLVVTIGVCFAIGESAAGEQCKGINSASIAVEGSSQAKFIPSGWRTEQEVSGDLNNDGRADAVLELIEDKAATEAERQRVMLVLLRMPNDTFKRIALGERLLRCAGCFGAMAGPEGGNAEISIRRGVLVVSQLWGSRETGASTLRFRFEPSSNRMQLIGEDLEFDDRATGASVKESSNLLSGFRIRSGKVYDESAEKLVKLRSRKEALPKAKRHLEDLDCEDYEKRIEEISHGA